MSGYDIHLVGSIPLRNATEVFETVSAALGPRLLRIPEGETGERAEWMGWIDRDFQSHPDLEPTDETFRPHAAGRSTIRYRLKPSAQAELISFDNLRHASFAIESYDLFVHLKKTGKILSHCRYQFAMAHPISVTNHYAVGSAQDAIERAYERGLVRQITKMLAVIPPKDLAIQWDLGSTVFAPLQLGTPTRHGATKQEMLDTICASCVRIGNAVPAEADLLYHLCYGNSGHRHAIEPIDMRDMVELASQLSAAIARPIQLFHMPVPRDRDDDRYFEPLAGLTMQPQSRVSLGLIHMTDGKPGAERRLTVAQRYLADFLIATECGFGRRPPESIPALLQLHAELAGVRNPR